jgi:hypothetical protein
MNSKGPYNAKNACISDNMQNINSHYCWCEWCAYNGSHKVHAIVLTLATLFGACTLQTMRCM